MKKYFQIKNLEPSKKMWILIIAAMMTAMMILPAVSLSNGTTGVYVPLGPVAGGDGDNGIQTVTIQPNATVGKDSWILTSTPDTNYGDGSDLSVGTDMVPAVGHGLVQFNIPGGPKRVLRADLYLYCVAVNSQPFGVNLTVYPITRSWTEGTGGVFNDATWNNRTTGIPWTTPGGDYNTTLFAYRNVSIENCWFNWNVTSIVDAWVRGAIPNYGFLLNGTPINCPWNWVDLYTSDYTTDPTLVPKLIISYHTEIDPAVPGQVMDEDDPQRVISLRGRGHGSIVHVSGPDDTNNNWPFGGASGLGEEFHFQALYTPEQVGAEGVIKRISFNRTNAAVVGNFSNFKISFAHTDLSDLTTTFANNYNGYLVEVFSEANVELNSSDGDSWIHFDLNDNFTYDSSHNLLIDIIWIGDGGVTIGTRNTDPGVITKRLWEWDVTAAVGQQGSNRLPVIRFETDVVDNAVIDEGTTNNIVPFWPTQPQMKAQMLFNKTFINQTGIIDKLCFQSASGTPVSGTYNDFSIRMAHSTNDSLGIVFEANHIGSWVEVLNESTFDISSVGAPEWIEFDLQNTFNYNGNDNLLIEIRWTSGSGNQVPLETQSLGYTCRATASDYSATTATSSDGVFYNFQMIFANSVNLTWSASGSNPALFTASVSGGTDLQITPQADAFGSGIVYLVLANSDGYTASQQIPVTINPINDAPVLSGVPSLIYCIEDVNYSLDMTPYASDIDDDFVNLTFNTDSPYAFSDGHTIIFNYPEGITNDSVTITVEDPDGLTDSVVVDVEITPVNDEPVLTGFVNTLTCDATVSEDYIISPDDEETPGNITIFVDSVYATVNGNTITFLYPKGIGNETVTIYVEDEEIYGSQNNVSYTLHVTIIDHPEVVSHSPTGLNVTLTTTVTVTFDMAMNRSTTEASFSLSTASGADINGTFSWNTANTMLTFTPVAYLTDGPHEVTIGTGATNETGVLMLEAFSWNFTASGSADGDGDLMPDSYEINNGLNPTINDAASDRDGDGASNFDEYLAGTDPSDPNDKPPSDIPWLLIILIILIVIIVIVVAIIMLMKKGKRDPRDLEPDAPPMEQPPQDI